MLGVLITIGGLVVSWLVVGGGGVSIGGGGMAIGGGSVISLGGHTSGQGGDQETDKRL